MGNETPSPIAPFGQKMETIEDVQLVGVPPTLQWSKGLTIFVASVFILACYGVVAYFKIDKLEAMNTKLVSQVFLLEAKVKGNETLRAKSAYLSRALEAEIVRNNQLAVENTSFKDRVVQGERDLKVALDKLKAFEK